MTTTQTSNATVNGTAKSAPNGVPSATTGSQHKFNPDFTQHVINTMGPNVTPRNRQIFSAFFRHLHDFTREVELTTEEWLASVKFLNSIGQISDSRRNEGHRMCDIVGLESLVDEINYYHNAEKLETTPTSSAILGPFWSPNSPFRDIGDSIIMSPHNGQLTRMHGVVTDAGTGKPIPGAVVDIWQASSNGKYDFQDPENQVDNNLRGKFRCNDKGEYWFYCLKPTAYSLPTDGPAGELLKILDRHAMRPAHIHLMVTSPDYRPLINQIYPRDDPYLATDTVFAVKDDLVVDFHPSKDPKAQLDLEFNMTLIPKSALESSEPIKIGSTQNQN